MYRNVTRGYIYTLTKYYYSFR